MGGDIKSAVLRTIASYIVLMLLTRAMGRKAISQMTFSDFCIAITVGSVTADAAISKDGSFYPTIAAMVSFALLGLLTDFFQIKSLFFRKLMNSGPLILVENNRIMRANMKKARITLPELTALLRDKNVFDISEVNYAIMEIDGKLSVLLKSGKSPVIKEDLQLSQPDMGLTYELILDGKIMPENLMAAQITEKKLLEKLSEKGIGGAEEVFFAAINSSGGLYVSKQSHKKNQTQGIE